VVLYGNEAQSAANLAPDKTHVQVGAISLVKTLTTAPAVPASPMSLMPTAGLWRGRVLGVTADLAV
jgi:hypothetical protein